MLVPCDTDGLCTCHDVDVFDVDVSRCSWSLSLEFKCRKANYAPRVYHPSHVG
jgi:hypothetical protein